MAFFPDLLYSVLTGTRLLETRFLPLKRSTIDDLGILGEKKTYQSFTKKPDLPPELGNFLDSGFCPASDRILILHLFKTWSQHLAL